MHIAHDFYNEEAYEIYFNRNFNSNWKVEKNNKFSVT